MTTANVVLKTLIGSYGNTRALKDGTVTAPGITLDFVEVVPVYPAFPRVIAEEFDVAELAVTTYLVARAFGKPLTGLPVVLFRKFHHGTILYNVKSGIREPKDLEGRRVGMRAFAQTGPTWSRGILQSEYGVDLGKVRWVTFEGSHVREFQDPPNVARAPEDKKMADMLVAGEIDAAIGVEGFSSPAVRPLIPDAARVEAAWFRKTGIYPVNHMVVVKRSVVDAHPGVLAALLGAFKTAKELYLDRLTREGPASADDRLALQLKEMVGGDPFPYGVPKDRKAYETLARFAFEHGMLPKPYGVEDLFDRSILDLE